MSIRFNSLGRCGYLLALVVATACGRDTAIAPSGDAHTNFSRFILAERQFNLTTASGYNTVRLPLTAQFADGTPAQGRIRYTASDTSVTVDSTGLVTARFPTDAGATPATVTASLQINGVTRTESAHILVTAGVRSPLVAGIVIRPLPDSLPEMTVVPLAFIFGTQLRVFARDAQGNPIPGIVLSTRTDDSTIATIDTTGFVTPGNAGTTYLHVSTFADGHEWRDSLRFTVNTPRGFAFNLTTKVIRGADTTFTFGTDTARVSRGAVVVWSNTFPRPLDIVFDDPTHIDSASAGPPPFFDPGLPATGRGNIDAFYLPSDFPLPSDTLNYGADRARVQYLHWFRARAFPVVGTYPFHSVLTGVHGVVIVCEKLCS